MSPHATIDLEDLGLDRGAHLLIERALGALPVGGRLDVRGRDPALGVHLRAWARARGHALRSTRARSCAAAPTATAGSTPSAPAALRPADVLERPGATLGPRRARRAGRAGRSGRPLRPRGKTPGLGRAGAAPVRPGRRQPVGPGDGRRLGRAVRAGARDRGGGRPGDDLSGRKRAGGADRPGPLSGPHSPAFSRSAAGAGRAGRRRSAPHRRVRPPRGAAGRSARRLGRGRPRVADHAARGAGLCARVVLAVGAGRGQFLEPARLSRDPRAGSGCPAHDSSRPPGRVAPRRLRHGPPRAPGPRWIPRCAVGCARPSSGATTRCSTRPA